MTKLLLSAIGAALLSALAGTAAAQASGERRIEGEDLADGGKAAWSGRDAEITYKKAPSPSSAIVVWTEVEKSPNAPAVVRISGFRARCLLPDEAESETSSGAYDPPDPAFVGSPWREADLVYKERKTVCISDQYWCTRELHFDLRLTPEQVRELIAPKAPNGIRVSLFRKTTVEVRLPKTELIATLEAAGAAAEFR